MLTMPQLVMRIGLVAFAILGTGCAGNTLLRLEARDFSKEAQSASASARDFYDGWVARDQEFWAAAYSLEPRCLPPSFRNKSIPLPPVRVPKIAAACEKLEYDLRKKDLAVEYAGIRFVSDYATLLAKIAADPESSNAETFSKIIDDLNALASAAEQEGIAESKQKSVASLVGVFGKIASDAKSASLVEALFEKNGDEAKRHMNHLANALLEDSRADAQRSQLDLIQFRSVLATLRQEDPARSSFLKHLYSLEERDYQRELELSVCRSSKLVKEKPELEKYCGKRAAALMHATSNLHQEVSELIAGRPSKRQRQRGAELAYANFIEFAKVFGALIAAF